MINFRDNGKAAGDDVDILESNAENNGSASNSLSITTTEPEPSPCSSISSNDCEILEVFPIANKMGNVNDRPLSISPSWSPQSTMTENIEMDAIDYLCNSDNDFDKPCDSDEVMPASVSSENTRRESTNVSDEANEKGGDCSTQIENVEENDKNGCTTPKVSRQDKQVSKTFSNHKKFHYKAWATTNDVDKKTRNKISARDPDPVNSALSVHNEESNNSIPNSNLQENAAIAKSANENSNALPQVGSEDELILSSYINKEQAQSRALAIGKAEAQREIWAFSALIRVGNMFRNSTESNISTLASDTLPNQRASQKKLQAVVSREDDLSQRKQKHNSEVDRTTTTIGCWSSSEVTQDFENFDDRTQNDSVSDAEPELIDLTSD